MVLFWIKESFKLIGRAKSSFFLSLFSMCISVMLITASLLSVVLSRHFQNNLKKNFSINIFLKDDATQSSTSSLRDYLDKNKYTNTVKYISKEEAADIFVKETGEDFRKLLDYNPMPASYVVTLKPVYVKKDSLDKIINSFSEQQGVDDVVFRQDFVYKVLDIISTVQKYIFIFTGILIFISVYIVFSTVKLITKSKYDELETMKLVGAKLSTIKMPIILNAVFIGLVAGIISVSLTALSAYYLGRTEYLQRIITMYNGLFAVFIFAVGPLIGWMVSVFSLRKITLKI